MPIKAFYHDTVISSLLADGWTITDDPQPLAFDGQRMYSDPSEEREVIAASKRDKSIVVITKSFLGSSLLRDFEEALGQFTIVRLLLEYINDDRQVYLAVPERIYESVFAEKIGRLMIKSQQLRLIVFDERRKSIVEWVG